MAAEKGSLDIKTWRDGPVAADAARYLRDQFTKATKPVNQMAFLGSPMSKAGVQLAAAGWYRQPDAMCAVSHPVLVVPAGGG
jgi:hypothetical protein